MGQADQEQGSEKKEDNAGEKRRVKEREVRLKVACARKARVK